MSKLSLEELAERVDEANARIADLEEAVSALLAFMKNPSVDTCLRMNSALFHAEVTW
jgi:transcriptional regulator with XRE-family HTH domain